jgi:hypothetical protein
MSIVKLEVVLVPNSTTDVKSSKKMTPKILPGVTHTLAPVLDKYGRIVTGCTEEKYKEIIANDMGSTEPLSYFDFYKNFFVKVTSKGKELNLDVPKHKLIYEFLKTQPDVANNGEKVNSSKHFFYLIDKEEEAKSKLSSIDFKMKAYSYLNEMGSEDIGSFLVLYGKDFRNVSPALSKAKLGELIEKDPAKFISLYEDNNREVRTNLRKMVLHSIVRKEGPAHFYGDEGDAIFLGGSEELAVEFLKENKNQDLYINLLKVLEDK